MATGLTPNYSLHYPLPTDPVNVAGDIELLAEDVDTALVNKASLSSANIFTNTNAFQSTLTANTAAADTNTTQVATTAFVLGQASASTPIIDGTATAGTSLRYSRQDHVHPTDTSRAPLSSPSLTGTPLSTTAAADTNTTQIATTAFVLGQAGSASPIINGTATAGTSLRYSRQDHVHPTDTSRSPLASPTFTGQVTVPAGTTSAAPVIFQSGSLLTNAAGGRMEYDGRLHYLTPSSTAVGGRGVAQTTHYYALNGDRTISNVNTVQSIFGVGLTVQATTTYEIEMSVAVSSTGTTSNSLGLSFGGTATLTSIAYQVESTQNATSLATLSSGSQSFISTAANTTITAAVATATYRTVLVKGIVRINASGTFIPQLTYSAAPGVAPVVSSNSFIKMTPIGSNTVTTVGAWA